MQISYQYSDHDFYSQYIFFFGFGFKFIFIVIITNINISKIWITKIKKKLSSKLKHAWMQIVAEGIICII